MPRRLVRASEIGRFAYCQRAWWYAHQGEIPRDPGRMMAGSEAHRQHGRRAAGMIRARRAACVLLFAAAVSAVLEVLLRVGD